MKSSSQHSAASAEPNLTPVLDLVFQLITFFMLVINFKAASIDTSIRLPIFGSARPVDGQHQSEVIVLNIEPSGEVNVLGERRDVEEYLLNEAQVYVHTAGRSHQQIKVGDELPTHVVVRADESTPFTAVNRTLMACQRYGFHNVALKVRDMEPSKQLR